MGTKAGRKFGRWTLQEELGRGGNAVVWRGADENGKAAAIKILSRTSAKSDRYQRFRDEIAVLERMGSEPGILPLLDRSLPEKPTAANPGRLAMPIAKPLREGIGLDPRLEIIVAGIAAVARVLERLRDKFRVSHRDLKPENLFVYEREWVVGDFGLAYYPEKEPLTLPGKKLGPLYYIAPEMLNSPDSAKGEPADVYSLAKCAWALATGQAYPLPGQHIVGQPAFSIGSYRNDEGASLLDPLLSRSTSADPDERPSMSEFAAELGSWLERPRQSDQPKGLSVALKQATLGLQVTRDLARQQAQRETLFAEVFEDVAAKLDALVRRVEGAVGLAAVVRSEDRLHFIPPTQTSEIGTQRPSRQEYYHKTFRSRHGASTNLTVFGAVRLIGTQVAVDMRAIAYEETAHGGLGARLSNHTQSVIGAPESIEFRNQLVDAFNLIGDGFVEALGAFVERSAKC